MSSASGQQPFLHEQISLHTFKVVEDDPYGQYPFLYVTLASDKCVVIDTGCGKMIIVRIDRWIDR